MDQHQQRILCEAMYYLIIIHLDCMYLPKCTRGTGTCTVSFSIEFTVIIKLHELTTIYVILHQCWDSLLGIIN